MQFRKDINGLRAIAVIAVVLFHFNNSWLPGGFAGVDVFFVISGFLMTGIIFKGLEQDNFSILKFYVARANRIIPALTVLCLTLLIIGWFYFTPLEYKSLGKHVSSSMLFLSNIIYWKESGYFDVASHEKWLLHTWSLSVEWQFYIIYPMLLVAMKRFISLNSIKTVMLFGSVLGFIFCVVITYKWPSPAYYLLPARAWEMMFGGVAYLYPLKITKNKKRILELLGLALIILSYIFISKENLWPGYLAFIPVSGAFLLIQAQRNNSIITSNIVFQSLGKWSYSIYLWHWPFVVVIYKYSLNDIYIYWSLISSLLLGFLSYKYIERIHFKNNFNELSSYLKCNPIYFKVTIIFCGGLIFLTNGALIRFDNEDQKKYKNAIAAIDDRDYPSPNLILGENKIRFIKGSSTKNILFIGASHIEQTYPYVNNSHSKYNIYYLTKGGCLAIPSYIDQAGKKNNCSNITNYSSVIEGIRFDKIVTSFYLFGKYLSKDKKLEEKQIAIRQSQYDQFLHYLKENTNDVYLILGEPTGAEFSPELSLRLNLKNYITIEKARERYATHYESLTKLKEVSNITIIDPINHLCDDICNTMDEEYRFYYTDSSHMRPWYAKKSLTYLKEILE